MITYRLQLTVVDGITEKTELREIAALDVMSLHSIDDREAFDFLAGVVRNALVPEGSTIVERDCVRPFRDEASCHAKVGP